MADSIYAFLNAIPDKRVSKALVSVFQRFVPASIAATTGTMVLLDSNGNSGAIKGTSLAIGTTGSEVSLAASIAEINQVCQSSSKFVAGGATIAVTQALHNGKTILLDTAAGTTATLPAATGSGARYRFMVSVLATSNSHVVKVANGTDFMVGILSSLSDDATGGPIKGWAAVNSGTVATNSDTITLNRSTTGSVNKGEWIEIEDFAANTFLVRGMTSSTGTEATPFSAAV